MVRRCWVNFQGVLLIWIIVGQGPMALAVGAGRGCWDIFLSSVFSLLFLPLWQTARYRLKYCLKGPFNPKQPTNQEHQYAILISLSYWISHKILCSNVDSSPGRIAVTGDRKSKNSEL